MFAMNMVFVICFNFIFASLQMDGTMGFILCRKKCNRSSLLPCNARCDKYYESCFQSSHYMFDKMKCIACRSNCHKCCRGEGNPPITETKSNRNGRNYFLAVGLMKVKNIVDGAIPNGEYRIPNAHGNIKQDKEEYSFPKSLFFTHQQFYYRG